MQLILKCKVPGTDTGWLCPSGSSWRIRRGSAPPSGGRRGRAWTSPWPCPQSCASPGERPLAGFLPGSPAKIFRATTSRRAGAQWVTSRTGSCSVECCATLYSSSWLWKSTRTCFLSAEVCLKFLPDWGKKTRSIFAPVHLGLDLL